MQQFFKACCVAVTVACTAGAQALNADPNEYFGDRALDESAAPSMAPSVAPSISPSFAPSVSPSEAPVFEPECPETCLVEGPPPRAQGLAPVDIGVCSNTPTGPYVIDSGESCGKGCGTCYIRDPDPDCPDTCQFQIRGEDTERTNDDEFVEGVCFLVPLPGAVDTEQSCGKGCGTCQIITESLCDRTANGMPGAPCTGRPCSCFISDDPDFSTGCNDVAEVVNDEDGSLDVCTEAGSNGCTAPSGGCPENNCNAVAVKLPDGPNGPYRGGCCPSVEAGTGECDINEKRNRLF